MKIYCKNCKFRKGFIKHIHSTIVFYYCRAIKEDEVFNKYTGIYLRYKKYFNNFNHNKTGKCKYYKRSWWKFWIKER